MTENRPKLRLLLTETELRRLDGAVLQSGALSRTLLVQEAIQAGLRQSDLRDAQRRRCKQVNVRLPKELTDRVEKLARSNGLTKQSLLRHLLHQYLEAQPWKKMNTLNRQCHSKLESDNVVTDYERGLPQLTSIQMRDEDLPEYERMKRELAKVLEKMGGYEPAVDELFIDQASRAVIYSKNIETLLDADTATEHTYSRAVDTKLKLWKIAEAALRQLALGRRDRLTKQTQGDLMKQLRDAMLRGLSSGTK